MQFSMPDVPPEQCPEAKVEIGNVYQAKGGSKTKYWVVIGISDNRVHVVGLDSEGAMVSVASYYKHVFCGGSMWRPREVIGRVEGLDSLMFDIQLFGASHAE